MMPPPMVQERIPVQLAPATPPPADIEPSARTLNKNSILMLVGYVLSILSIGFLLLGFVFMLPILSIAAGIIYAVIFIPNWVFAIVAVAISIAALVIGIVTFIKTLNYYRMSDGGLKSVWLLSSVLLVLAAVLLSVSVTALITGLVQIF